MGREEADRVKRGVQSNGLGSYPIYTTLLEEYTLTCASLLGVCEFLINESLTSDHR